MRKLFVLFLCLLIAVAPQADARKKKHKLKKHAKPVAAAVYSPVAKEVFGRQTIPAAMAARSIGGYARGCLAGAKPLPVDGPAWQAMRLSRNRNWGHPALVAYVEKLAQAAQKHDGWHGLLVGDLAQPRGGPMLTGHASHQIGLDADIWLNQMPDRTLSPDERETISAVSMLAADGVSVDRKIWTPEHVKLIKRAASYPQVARVFVHPAIKQALCTDAGKDDREWLTKVRPWWGHHYHFHVRLKCPAGQAGCVGQLPAGTEDGCGKEVDSWLKKLKKKPVAEPAPKPRVPIKPKRQMTLAQLPKECSMLVSAPPGPAVTVPTEAMPIPERKPAEAAHGKSSASRS